LLKIKRFFIEANMGMGYRWKELDRIYGRKSIALLFADVLFADGLQNLFHRLL
jgi:hypothetical protein